MEVTHWRTTMALTSGFVLPTILYTRLLVIILVLSSTNTIDLVLETAVLVSRPPQTGFLRSSRLGTCGLGLEGSDLAVFETENNLWACVRRQIIILFAQVNNKDGNFFINFTKFDAACELCNRLMMVALQRSWNLTVIVTVSNVYLQCVFVIGLCFVWRSWSLSWRSCSWSWHSLSWLHDWQIHQLFSPMCWKSTPISIITV